MFMTSHPTDDLVPEEQLRAALRPLKVNAAAFKAGVLDRIDALEAEQAADPFAHSSSFFRAAAAILPVPILGGKAAGVAAVGKTSVLSQVLGFVALPAVSLFVMLGAGVFTAIRIRTIQSSNVLAHEDAEATDSVAKQWWRQNWWLAALFFVATIALPLLGYTPLLLLVYLISLGLLLWILQGFAKCGIGSRRLIGGSCVMGLGFLAQASLFCTVGRQEIHLLDQSTIAAVLAFGAALLMSCVPPLRGITDPELSERQRWQRIIFGIILIPLILWMVVPIWIPLTTTQIARNVESFDSAPFSSASWSAWEIEARWTLEAGLHPDLSRPRKLFLNQDWGNLTPLVAGTALRTRLVTVDQIVAKTHVGQYEQRLKSLLDPDAVALKQTILSLDQEEWVIQSALLQNRLTAADRDRLSKRLHFNLQKMWTDPDRKLDDALRVTQVLAAIDRPLDRELFRPQVHAMLREFHMTDGGFFQDSGGFRPYLSVNSSDLSATARAVELMQVFGVPEGIELDWVRSYLRPSMLNSDRRFEIAAVRERLNHLPGIPHPTWLTYLYYEPSLIMAVLLVGMCFYATLTSPDDKRVVAVL